MTRLFAAVAVTLAVVGCSHPVKAAAPVATEGKPSAPVAVEAVLREDSATLTLTFEGDASNVLVGVAGLDGLEVDGGGVVVAEGAFRRGETRVVEVRFSPGVGRSHLAVSVEGQFRSGRLARVVTFAVGAPSPEQLRGSGTTIEARDGTRLKVLSNRVE